MKDYNIVNWKEFMYYDETSPTFLRWKIDRRCGKGGCTIKKAAGDVVGGIAENGYAVTRFCGKIHRCHRIIWILFHGSIDTKLHIDHIDGCPANNCINNLRLVTVSANSRNRREQSNNTTGVTGVQLASDGKNNHYYAAGWNDLCGKKVYKYFSISKFGESEAFRLACEYRRHIVEELNAQGAGYTERHGV